MDIFQSKNFQTFLRNYIAQLPKKGRGEVTRIASALSVSTTLVSQVLAGQKLFTAEQGQLLITYLGLTSIEQDYVTFLLQRDRAGSKALRDFWNQKLEKTREQSLNLSNRVTIDRKLSDNERSIFYSNPLYSAIRLYASVGTTGKTLDEIAERFDQSRAKILEMLNFLVEAGLCRVEANRYFMGAQKTHIEEGSPHLLRHHCNWRLRAIRESEDLSKQELMYTAPVSLSKEDFELLREKMVVFIGQFLDQVHQSPAEEIACFNLDFFWIKK